MTNNGIQQNEATAKVETTEIQPYCASTQNNNMAKNLPNLPKQTNASVHPTGNSHPGAYAPFSQVIPCPMAS